MAAAGKRLERLQLLLSVEELETIDVWRYRNRIPSRSAAIRALLHRGLVSEQSGEPAHNAHSEDYGVLPDEAGKAF